MGAASRLGAALYACDQRSVPSGASLSVTQSKKNVSVGDSTPATMTSPAESTATR